MDSPRMNAPALLAAAGLTERPPLPTRRRSSQACDKHWQVAKRDSIRDVIAFPKVKDATCLLTNAPDVVDAKQLEDLSIRITESEQE